MRQPPAAGPNAVLWIAMIPRARPLLVAEKNLFVMIELCVGKQQPWPMRVGTRWRPRL